MTATATEGICRHCSGPLEIIHDCPPHWGRYHCPACGRGAGYAPTPMEPAAVAAWVMPFGKFKGKPLAEIASTEQGRRYLEWAAGNLDKPRLREVIAYFLSLEPVEAR